ncbi:MAG: cytochrome c family protein [Sulfurimonas sp.]|uniref:multiheme c-type cytochrome n=1 Tax=Sulfurimonas sp. TaxID=2022749 RepID=UPI0025EBF79F|nr:multiheme c-type cytochrome [Sulfurimonas sp.]MCK9491312.1 cytochrome c family protein [Sulfurimonas sp.]
MKLFLLFTLLVSALYSAKVVEVAQEYQSSQKCKACHLEIVKDWEDSWHAKSHYDKDEYFSKSIEYVARKSRKSPNSVKVQCATCHNPRIAVTDTGLDYEIQVLMDLDGNSKVNEAIESSVINEGINCVVCHNIDKIHHDRDDSFRGMDRVSWTKSGLMVGPFDNTTSPYHKNEHRDFMDTKSDELCFVCHANDRSVNGIVFTNMQDEYKKQEKGCVDCHMGAQTLGVASTLRTEKGHTRKREVRKHSFPGAHTQEMWVNALTLELWQEQDEILIALKNPQPHNIPSGFGSRELIIDITYMKLDQVVESKSISLTRHYTRRKGKPTIPHLAEEMSEDISIPADGKKVLKVKKEADASSVEVKVYYRLVNEEVHSILDLKEAIWSKKFFVNSKSLNLK